jgi:hypothetical protein
MPIQLKHVRDRVSPLDGARVLVDRLWPRGVSKETLALTEWRRDVAPSAELRRCACRRACACACAAGRGTARVARRTHGLRAQRSRVQHAATNVG